MAQQQTGDLRHARTGIELRPGLVRLAQLAQSRGVSVPVVPVGLGYSQAPPLPFSRAALCFGAPLSVPAKGDREATRQFNSELAAAMHTAEQAARAAVGRPLQSF